MTFSRDRFGYHVVYDGDLHDAIDFASEHGFGYIVPDLMIPRFWPESFDHYEREEIKGHAEDRGVSISFHAPSDGLNLVAPYPEIRLSIIRRLELGLWLARELGAERYTIHPTQPPDFASGGGPGTHLDDHRKVYSGAFREVIHSITSEADGVKICVENDPLTPFVEGMLEELFDEVDNLFLTLDVPKALDPDKGEPIERVESFFRRNRSRVMEVHLHNRRPGGRFHDSLVHGEVDVLSYIRKLMPLDSHYTLEIRPREAAFESLLWLKERWR